MKKKDIYKIRSLFEKLERDYSNDRASDRADKVHKTIKEGVALCNDYINKMKPIRASARNDG